MSGHHNSNLMEIKHHPHMNETLNPLEEVALTQQNGRHHESMHKVSDASRLLLPLKPFFDNPNLSEIIINKPQEVWIEEKGKWKCFDVPELKASHLNQLFRLVANESHQSFDKARPLLSASLHDGSRIQCVHPPTSVEFSAAIRRKVIHNYTLSDYSKANFYQNLKPTQLGVDTINDLTVEDSELLKLFAKKDWENFIKLAIRFKKNIVVSGGTSTGKTTFLNACLREIDLNERIITLEDVREVDILHKNKVQLLASKGQQGEAKITMQDLVQCCLRLRPDRIIMGEIRGAEIMDFVNACSTGHEGSITSVHANNPNIAFMRMVQMYKLNNVPSMTNEDILSELKQVIDIVIQVGKNGGMREATGIYYRYQNLANQIKN